MGAGNSTAASCSSLDLANGRRNRYHHYYRRRQDGSQLEPVPGQAKHYRRQRPDRCQLRQASSHSDLSTALDQTGGLNYGFQRAQAVPSEIHYQLTNADVTRVRQQVLPLAAPAKKSNAGVASRILQQRQLHQRQHLGKFSDSSPSLNQIVLRQAQSPSPLLAAADHFHHYLPPPNLKQIQLEQYQPKSPRDRISAIKQQKPTTSKPSTSKQRVSPSGHLVSQVSDAAVGRPNLKQGAGSRQCRARPMAVAGHEGGQQSVIHQNRREFELARGQSAMQRATSLSALHSLNPSNQRHPHDVVHHRHHNHLNQQQQQHRAMPVCLPRPPSARIESANLSYQQRAIGQLYRLPPQSRLSGQPVEQQLAAMKKGDKFVKQPASSKPASQKALKSNRYKTKQQQQVQQQQQLQGCPVLPQLPRSQSLHELIHLRKTENGQRMRTTGTLRNPVSGGEQASGKVNLVAELLESRRRQRESEPKADGESAKNSETLLSQSSSSDDGIHDISTGGNGSNQLGGSSSNSSAASSSARQRAFKQLPSGQHPNRFAQKTANQLDAHKSTLRRSSSYSALQAATSSAGTNRSKSNSYDEGDGDESDDLNELARFLFSFEQRQAKSAEVKSRAGAGEVSSPPVSDSAGDNLQQSPNSTASSSGFASSTGTSNSVESGAKCKFAGQKKADGLAKRSKYPALTRPDQKLEVRLASSESGGNKLQAASSLLSIVDEYQSSFAVGGGVKSNKSDETQLEREHFEHLRKYTKQRQMSQSELALNHLGSSAQVLSGSKSKVGKRNCKLASGEGLENNNKSNSNSKPYARRLFNLIRRIGDRSEGLASPAGGRPFSEPHDESEMGSLAPIDQKSRPRGARDLNFDCDFELVKNCGGANTTGERSSGQTSCPQSDAERKSSSLFNSAATSSSNELGDEKTSSQLDGANAKWGPKRSAPERKGAKANPSGGEQNWRFASASCSSFTQAGDTFDRTHQDAGNYNNKQADGQKRIAAEGLARNSSGQQQSKSKWSASSWLLLGGGSGDKQRGNSSKQHGRGAKQTDSNSGQVGKSYLARLMAASSGTPARECKQPDDMANEAGRLLVELDHSLDSVRSECNEQRHWWQQVAGGSSERADSESSLAGEHEDEHDNDDADYASLNRALLNETFEMDLDKVEKLAGSSSSSFTFSAPNSPEPEANWKALASDAERRSKMAESVDADPNQIDACKGVSAAKSREHSECECAKSLPMEQPVACQIASCAACCKSGSSRDHNVRLEVGSEIDCLTNGKLCSCSSQLQVTSGVNCSGLRQIKADGRPNDLAVCSIQSQQAICCPPCCCGHSGGLDVKNCQITRAPVKQSHTKQQHRPNCARRTDELNPTDEIELNPVEAKRQKFCLARQQRQQQQQQPSQTESKANVNTTPAGDSARFSCPSGPDDKLIIHSTSCYCSAPLDADAKAKRKTGAKWNETPVASGGAKADSSCLQLRAAALDVTSGRVGVCCQSSSHATGNLAPATKNGNHHDHHPNCRCCCRWGASRDFQPVACESPTGGGERRLEPSHQAGERRHRIEANHNDIQKAQSGGQQLESPLALRAGQHNGHFNRDMSNSRRSRETKPAKLETRPETNKLPISRTASGGAVQAVVECLNERCDMARQDKQQLAGCARDLAKHLNGLGPSRVASYLMPFAKLGDGGKPASGAADFDENFILKRKTPNAGLKSRG